jgi:hypothetical protein
MSRNVEYVSETRAAARQLWDAVNKLKSLQRESNALDYGTTLVVPQDGAHAGITKEAVGAVVFDTANAMVAVLDAGHATNVSKLL